MKLLEKYHGEIRYVLMGFIVVYLVWANELTAVSALGIFAGILFPTTIAFSEFLGGNNAKGSSKQ